MVKKVLNLLFILGFMGIFAIGAKAEETEKSDFKGKVSAGYHFNDINGSAAKIGEYENLKQGAADGPDLSFFLKGHGDNFSLDVGGLYGGDKNDQEYYLNGDINRIFLERYEYNRFHHSLDHDPLTNLSAVLGGPKVSHQDFDVGRDYMIYYSEQESNSTINLPFLPGAQISFDYRQQIRRGHKQALTMSKCAACHITSRGRTVNEETEDYKAKAQVKFGWLTLMYNFLHRDFREKANAPMNQYDEAMHPGNGVKMFDDRVQYNDENLAYSQVPSSKKDSHLIKALAALPKHTSFYLSYLNSDIENRENDLSTDQDVITARITNRLIPGLKLNLDFRYLSLDNDDTYVDVVEPLSVAGANAGFPWDNHNPALPYNSFDPDFTRRSAMSRDVTTVGFNARYRLLKKTTVRLDYEWEKIDRDYYEVDNGDTETKKNTIKLGLKSRLHRKLKAKISYKRQDIDNPFNNLNAGHEVVDPSSIYGSPFTGLQYWERQEDRIATLSNQPTAINEIKTDLHWSIKSNLSLSADFSWIDKKNDETDFSDWEQESYRPSVNLWYAPMERLSFNVSYMYDKTKTDSVIHMPVFDG